MKEYYKEELKKLRGLYEKGLYVPEFYHKKLNDINMLNSYDEFIKIPFTYKQELRDTSVEERTTTASGEIFGVFSSSGTTGDKTFYIYNKKDKRVHEKFVCEFFSKIGIGENDLGGVMAPVDTGVMAHTMMWQFTTVGAGYVNCPEPSPENMTEFIEKIPITAIATRPNIATGMAYSEEARLKARNSKVKKLLMGGGFLSSERRKLLENTWNADCYNLFGMSEMFGPMAAECFEKNGLHYLNDYLMIEIIDPDTGMPVKEGEAGVAVYTTLWEKGFPLLRYWTNDMMMITSEKCACGSVYPRIFYLGRLNDSIKINGKYIFPENVENILFKNRYYGDYHVEKNNSIVIKTESIETDIRNGLQEELNALFGSQVQIEIVMPGSLSYDGHGKRFEVKEQC